MNRKMIETVYLYFTIWSIIVIVVAAFSIPLWAYAALVIYFFGSFVIFHLENRAISKKEAEA